MRKLTLSVLVVAAAMHSAAFAQGTTQPPTSFATMDDVAAYNATVDYNDQIVCQNWAPWTGGMLNDRHICMTRVEWRKQEQRTELGRDLNHFVHQ